ncbi:polysaccharide biosynthesis/export family protein [Puniceibacterium sediminis]|uniref:Polysaccharide export outer membrane protein n=1 Tax=Puniceibacterium sediminis TaxID=1608407 RepID=A0A238VTA8_9RHOB|nr:polysaccharide biosynthesis/export family protein [Puniceibacterium sediminis]SNR37033.1 polysaccharide export outer membrane protein [Puniceibacterium sediminis]
MLATVVSVGACSLPRGAALQSEVLAESQADNPTFQVVPVTRTNMPGIAAWPMTGQEYAYNWIGSSQGQNSSVIETGDLVDVIIWDSQENSLITGASEKVTALKSIEVGSDGAIFLPYVNEVHVRGLTPASARERVQSQFETIVPSAQVQLSLTPGLANSVDLLGGVARPDNYPMLSRNYKILTLLATGGGISPTMRNPVVKLLRGSSTYRITAKNLYESNGRNTTLHARDTIVVEEDQRSFTALGASGNEDLIYFPKDQITALEAMSLMGGIQDSRADPKGVMVLREYDTRQVRQDNTGPARQQVIFTFDLTSADGLFAARKFAIHPQDTVLATESPLTKAQTVFSLIGSVFGLTRQAQTFSAN